MRDQKDNGIAKQNCIYIIEGIVRPANGVNCRICIVYCEHTLAGIKNATQTTLRCEITLNVSWGETIHCEPTDRPINSESRRVRIELTISAATMRINKGSSRKQRQIVEQLNGLTGPFKCSSRSSDNRKLMWNYFLFMHQSAFNFTGHFNSLNHVFFSVLFSTCSNLKIFQKISENYAFWKKLFSFDRLKNWFIRKLTMAEWILFVLPWFFISINMIALLNVRNSKFGLQLIHTKLIKNKTEKKHSKVNFFV